MNNYLTPELIEVFEWTIKDAIVRTKNHELTYSTWKSYVNILKKSVYMQIPTINYYEFACLLVNARVRYEKEDDTEKHRKELEKLRKDISYAERLSQQTNKHIDFELFNAMSFDSAIRELYEFIERDRQEKKLAYIGKDGKDYFNLDDLLRANENYIKYKFPPIEKSYKNNLQYNEDKDNIRRLY